VLPDGDAPCGLAELRTAGVRVFVPRPLRADLFLLEVREHLRSESTDASRPAAAAGYDRRGFVDERAFLRELGACLPIMRAEGRHLALLFLTLTDDPPGVDWEVLDDAERQTVEQRVARALDTALDPARNRDVIPVRRSAIRVGRMDQRRFVVMVPDLERIQDAARLASRVQESLGGTLHLAGHTTRLFACIGVATFPGDGAEPVHLLECARTASERARGDGPNSVGYFTAAMGQWALERLTLEKSLRDALTNNELAVYYQPRCDIKTRRILGMEALVRWIHPQLGMVSPGQFIPLAEETGLIVPIGEWILREACRQNKVWRDAGLPPIRVSVNLSPVQFRDPELYQVIRNALDEHELAHDGLELEVTESMLMNDPKATTRTLRKLKSAGLHISIDDFGTGYSSLSYLKQFPIDALKIDRSFVSEVTTNADDAAIATAIILMGHSLKLSVVAEGVETESQLAFLRVLQCNEVQGFLISPPVPAEQARELLRADGAQRQAG
jgi:EAL domain-containing protein (putative c-di-GMP-specific phosphodiesterase class I)/GGDEF domain-containing protein